MVGTISQRVQGAVSRLGQGEGSQQAQEVDFQRGQVVAGLPVLGEAFRQVPVGDCRQGLVVAYPLDPAAGYRQALVADCRPAQVVEDQPVHVVDCRGGRPVGTDKLSGSARRIPSLFTDSGGDGHSVPRSVRLRAQDPESRAGDQMGLKIECVVDGGVAGKESLG